jgi:hypothetical protein
LYSNVACYDKDKNFISNINIASITIPENCYYIKIQWQSKIVSTQTVTNPQLEMGDIATNYESHNLIKIMIEEQVATFPLGEGKSLGEGDYLTDGGRYNANGTTEAYTAEQLAAWATIKNLTLNEGTNHITTGGNLAPKFKLKYKQLPLAVVKELLSE